MPHRLFPFPRTVAVGAQPRHRVPKDQRQQRGSASRQYRAQAPEDLLGDHREVEPERHRERQQRQVGEERHQPVKRAAVLALFDDPVIGARRDQQPDRADHQAERQRVKVARMRRQRLEPVLERAAELEPKQDLRAEDQHAGLVEPELNLLRQFHRAVLPQLRVEQ